MNAHGLQQLFQGIHFTEFQATLEKHSSRNDLAGKGLARLGILALGHEHDLPFVYVHKQTNVVMAPPGGRFFNPHRAEPGQIHSLDIGYDVMLLCRHPQGTSASLTPWPSHLIRGTRA